MKHYYWYKLSSLTFEYTRECKHVCSPLADTKAALLSVSLSVFASQGGDLRDKR